MRAPQGLLIRGLGVWLMWTDIRTHRTHISSCLFLMSADTVGVMCEWCMLVSAVPVGDMCELVTKA
jgi:hypothetical protein